MLTERYNYTPISRKTIEGKRHYATPDGNAVPSVTTILDKTKSEEKNKHSTTGRNELVLKKRNKLLPKLPAEALACINGLKTM